MLSLALAALMTKSLLPWGVISSALLCIRAMAALTPLPVCP
jgi:hypothetical protein